VCHSFGVCGASLTPFDAVMSSVWQSVWISGNCHDSLFPDPKSVRWVFKACEELGGAAVDIVLIHLSTMAMSSSDTDGRSEAFFLSDCVEGEEAGRFLVVCVFVSVSSVFSVVSDDGGWVAPVPEVGGSSELSMSSVMTSESCVRCLVFARVCLGAGMMKSVDSCSGGVSVSSSTSVSMESGANLL